MPPSSLLLLYLKSFEQDDPHELARRVTQRVRIQLTEAEQERLRQFCGHVATLLSKPKT
jgi:hypothetical protein